MRETFGRAPGIWGRVKKTFLLEGGSWEKKGEKGFLEKNPVRKGTFKKSSC